MRLKKIIIKKTCSKNNSEGESHLDFHDRFAEDQGEHFEAYVKKHGNHFSKELAEYASLHMVNVSEIGPDYKKPASPKHSWTADEVEEAFKKLGLEFKKEHKYDYQYAANMAYADFFKRSLPDEASCIKYAYDLVNDPDGYPEMVFTRWLADIMAKEEKIPWENFV